MLQAALPGLHGGAAAASLPPHLATTELFCWPQELPLALGSSAAPQDAGLSPGRTPAPAQAGQLSAAGPRGARTICTLGQAV